MITETKTKSMHHMYLNKDITAKEYKDYSAKLNGFTNDAERQRENVHKKGITILCFYLLYFFH